MPPATLRYYEEMGLLTDVGRTENKQRIYTEEHIQRLNAISCFKRTGLPITKMQEDLLHIEHKVRYYNGIKKAIQEQTEWPNWEDCK